MLASQLKDFVIIPVLDYLRLNSPSAINLLLGTCAAESDMGHYLRQINFDFESHKGAFGIFGIELATDDAITDYLDRPSYKTKKVNSKLKYVMDEKRTARKQELLLDVIGLRYSYFRYQIKSKVSYSGDDTKNTIKANLVGNLYYQCAIARCRYLMTPDPLPAADDIEGLANYWKEHYNSIDGKGTIEKFVKNYEKYVLRRT